MGVYLLYNLFWQLKSLVAITLLSNSIYLKCICVWSLSANHNTLRAIVVIIPYMLQVSRSGTDMHTPITAALPI